jgi:hypothetical protein
MSKNVLMIAFHCYRVYNIAKEYDKKKAFGAYQHLINTPLSSRNYHHQLYDYDRQRKLKQEEQLLHRTIRRPPSIIQRRMARTPRAFYNSSPESISYPFARRRNDGGRARTAFALYGLPFRTPQIPLPTTISSTSSLAAKAFVH